jgi:hypothetical protein
VVVAVVAVRVVKVPVMQVICVAAVTYRGMSTTWPVLMRVISMGWGGATRHEKSSFRGFGCADAAADFARQCL